MSAMFQPYTGVVSYCEMLLYDESSGAYCEVKHCVLSAKTQPHINHVLKRASHPTHLLKLVNLNGKQIGVFIQISHDK